MHKQRMRPPRNIRMNRNRENELIILAVKVIKVIAPDILNISRIHEPMTIGGLFNEHHRRQVIEVPVSGDLDEPGILAANQRLHPGLGLLLVVNLGPGIAGAQVVRLAIFMAHAVVIFDAVVQKQLCALAAGFPPVSCWRRVLVRCVYVLTMERRFRGEACRRNRSACDMSCRGYRAAAR